MKKSVKPSPIDGKLNAPSSKSVMQRMVAAALLAEGTSQIWRPSFCDDSLAAMRVAEDLGASLSKTSDSVIVEGGFAPRHNFLNCGESGLGVRMFTPIAALYPGKVSLTGSGSLLQRPVSMLEKPLSELGVRVSTQNGFLPISVRSGLKGGKAFVDGSVSSQALTGLLMALPLAPNESELTVESLKSKPYIDLTLQILAQFGVNVQHQNYEKFLIKGKQEYQPGDFTVEGDWSGAAFLLVAGAVSGKIEVSNLKIDTRQADRAILQAIEKAGAKVFFANGSVCVEKKQLRNFDFDATHCPDLFPPLVALAAQCNATSRIHGINRLLHKESNRADQLVKEFSKMGIRIETRENSMFVCGGTVRSASIDSHNDHRIAMAAAVAALNASGSVTINGAECISKSYPEFFFDLEKIGAKLYE